MSERSWTPGPWKIFTEFGTYSIGGCLDGRDDYPVAELWRTGLKNHEANARLIAAAPEMFELLEEFYKYLSVHSKGSKQIKEIIKRVRGTDGS